MNIVFDISHIAQVNFFKNSIEELIKKGHSVKILVLDRGKLISIVAKELQQVGYIALTRRGANILSIIFKANLLKFFRVLYIVMTSRIDIGVSYGSFLLGLALKLKGIPNLQFDEDIERRLSFYLERLTASKLFIPLMCGDSKNVYRYKGIKEWSYLSPDYFSPNINILSHYKVIPKEYLFVREVDTGSLNYIKQTDNVIASISDLLPRSLKVIFSLENKEKRRCYPQDWILLEEPLSDIFSLIYYSKILISSGDSMAREGAVLGVPSIYCGIRKMAVNKILQEKGVLFHVDPREVPVLVKKIIDTDSNAKSQEGFRCQLSAEWDNVTGLIVNEVENIFSGHA